MKLHPLSLCQLVFVSLCCVLITVRKTHSTFVPGRCLCPQTLQGVRGPMKDLTVYDKSPSCHSVTVIVTMRRNNQLVCLNPGAPMGKQLIRCWKKARKLGRDVKLCVKRRRARGRQQQRSEKRTRRHNKEQSPSTSQ